MALNVLNIIEFLNIIGTINATNLMSIIFKPVRCALSSFKIEVFFLCSNKSSRVLAPIRACGTKAQRVDSFGSHTNEREAWAQPVGRHWSSVRSAARAAALRIYHCEKWVVRPQLSLKVTWLPPQQATGGKSGPKLCPRLSTTVSRSPERQREMPRYRLRSRAITL